MINYKVGDIVKTVSIGCSEARKGDICKVLKVDSVDGGYATVKCIRGQASGQEYLQFADRFVLYEKQKVKIYGICNFVNKYYK